MIAGEHWCSRSLAQELDKYGSSLDSIRLSAKQKELSPVRLNSKEQHADGHRPEISSKGGVPHALLALSIPGGLAVARGGKPERRMLEGEDGLDGPSCEIEELKKTRLASLIA